ncbi:MAG TPA: hypothetical protein VGC37_08330 [Friedmanniella sp.]
MNDRSEPRGGHAARLVFVCYANHCRSPMMELLLRAALDRSALDRSDDPRLVVSSAGTHARPGVAAHPYAVQALAEHDVDAGGWRSTRLDVEDVERADLILTAATEQRQEVLALSGAAAGRTFTLLDLSAWLSAAPTGRSGTDAPTLLDVPALLDRAAAGRARLDDRHPGRDLPDPMGRSLRHFRRCRRRIEDALEPFLAG